MIRCDICVGSGKVMGGGMVYDDCYKCSGAGVVSAAYSESVESLKKSGLNDNDATQYLNDALRSEKKRGRPKRN